MDCSKIYAHILFIGVVFFHFIRDIELNILSKARINLKLLVDFILINVYSEIFNLRFSLPTIRY